MTDFNIGETVVCSITVKDVNGTLQNAATSMNVKIDRKDNLASILSETAMTNDSAGAYHYDFASASKAVGDYLVTYVAVDGTRTTIHTDSFKLV